MWESFCLQRGRCGKFTVCGGQCVGNLLFVRGGYQTAPLGGGGVQDDCC